MKGSTHTGMMWRGYTAEMSNDRSSQRASGVGARAATLGGSAFVASAITFFIAGILVIWEDPPPSDAPVIGMLSHGFWALAIALLAVGTAALTWQIESLRASLPSTLAAGTLSLGVVVGLQWVTWAYVDLRASEHEQYQLVLETVITPFGAGHVLMYGVLLGAGAAFFGWALARTGVAHRYVGWSGVLIGILTFLAAVASILAAFEGGSDGHWLYNVATLLLPLCYLWALVVGLSILRDGSASGP